METILEYIFWASAYLVLLSVVYRVAVKPHCGAEFARWFIVVGAVVSIVLPLVGLPLQFFQGSAAGQQGTAPEFMVLPEFVVTASGEVKQIQENINNFVLSQWVLAAILITVSVIMVIRNLLAFVLIATKVIKYGTEKNQGMPTVFLPGQTSPFSFFNLIFVPIELKNSPTLQYIITHERGHCKKLHTLDLILVEFIIVLFWFNPAVWYLRRQLKLQHEYAADNFVLETQLNKSEYQHALLNVAFYKNYLPMVASFNFHSLKNRIVMMNSKKTKNLKRVIVSVTTLTFAFALAMVLQSFSPSISQPQNDVSNSLEANEAVLEPPLQNQPPPPAPPAPPAPPQTHGSEKPEPREDVIFQVVEYAPSFPGGEEERLRFIRDNINYPKVARDKGIQGTVFVTFVVEKDGTITDSSILRGIGGGCDEEVLRITNLMPKWNPGLQRGNPVRTQFRMPVRFALNGDKPTEEQIQQQEQKTKEFWENYLKNPKTGMFLDGKKLETEEDLERAMRSGEKIEMRTEFVNENGEVEIRSALIEMSKINTGQE